MAALRLFLVAVLLLLSAASTTTTTAAPAQAKSGCSDKCGSLTIPYPFGMEEGCYLREEFFINCNHTTRPPTPYLMKGNLIVTNISVDGELRLFNYVGRDCYDKEGNQTRSTEPQLWLVPPYTISHTKNKFYAVGCDTAAILQGIREEEEFFTGCMSACNKLGKVDNSCSGVGCCQITIPSGLYNPTVAVSSFNSHKDIWKFNPCSYAFIAEERQFSFTRASLRDLNYIEKLPMVINWAIGNDRDPCDETQKRKDIACKAHSRCVNRPNHGSLGYLCECLPGYEGNPYHPDGCQDIDECKAPNPCQNGECSNSPGDYSCKCHKGYKHDRINGKSCIKDNSKSQLSKIVVPLIVSLGMLMSLLGAHNLTLKYR